MIYGPSEGRMTTAQSMKVAKLIGQIAVSVVGLTGGIYLCAAFPDLRPWGTGMVGFIVGYWLK
jgi:hypothetical protein